MNASIRRGILAGCTALITGFVIWSAQATAPSSLLSLGDQQWAAGQLDQAQQTFRQAMTQDPSSVTAYMKLAGLQLSRQEFKASIHTYQGAIGLNANNARAWLGLGFAYLHTGQDALSLAAFNEAVRIDPANEAKLGPVLTRLVAAAQPH